MVDASKYDRTIHLNCPTCGGTEFESDSSHPDDDEKIVKCPTCGYSTTQGELIAANSENIDSYVEEIKGQLAKDITKSFQAAFKGNKFIKFK